MIVNDIFDFILKSNYELQSINIDVNLLNFNIKSLYN